MGNRVSSVGDTRSLWLGGQPGPGDNTHYPDNRVVSAKYTLWNFLPKNLFEQFRRIANFYFLCITIISLVIDSPVSPLTSIVPLSFVIVVTMIKQGYEDFLRHCADNEVNSSIVTVIRNGCVQNVKSKLIRVGDLLRVSSENDIPCDMILLSSSNKDGKCFVTTANLDGETNLKTLISPRLLRYFSQPEQLSVLKALVECEQPTADLYKFYGKIEIFPDNAVELNGEVPLGRSSLMTIQSSESERNKNSVRRTSVNVNNDTPISRNSVVSFRASKISSEIPVDRNSVIKVNSDFNKNGIVNFQDNSENHHTNTPYEEISATNKKRRTTVRTNSGLSITSSRRHSVSLSAPLGTENILLRGTRLKNTEYVYGCAVYTGQETKLALNSRLTSNKFSTVEKSVNSFLLFFLGLLLLEVFLCLGLKYGIEFSEPFISGHSDYLGPSTPFDAAVVFQDIFSYVVLFNYIIPISLYVTMELQKFLGSLFFAWDLELYCDKTDQRAICNTSDLNEELGQVEYLFTDKTGTLTENDMQFRRCSVGGNVFFEQNGKLSRLLPDGNQEKGVKIDSLTPDLELFLIALALCHSVQVGTCDISNINNNAGETGSKLSLDYQASSPDEKALVEASARCGVMFLGEDGDLVSILVKGITRQYKKLDCLEFTSDRKRMSVVVEDEDGTIWLFCKGAESAVIPLSINGPIVETQNHLTEFAMRGLRTMVIGFRKMDVAQYNSLRAHIELSRQTLNSRRESIVAQSYFQMEQGLTLMGATGVEDRLQEGVQETLESLKAAGIKVWILTGDKVETAVNISFSCGHFKQGTEQLLLIDQRTEETCLKTLNELRIQVNSERFKQFGLVVDGMSLSFAIKHPEVLREVCTSCAAVICCRMSPLQKCEVVQLVKNAPFKPVTAAIGDGANDVSMIQEAHIGLGVMGKEGRQAVRCSDFAFARFKFVRRVLLVHGHWYYERISTLVQYFFYKNLVFITPAVFFQFYSLYSTQALYDSLYLTIFNLVCTSLPVMTYGLFEQTRSSKKLISYPQYYQEISNNVLMTWAPFFQWLAIGVWHSVVLYFVPWLLVMTNPVLLYDNSPVDMWCFNTIIFHNVVVVVNLKLLLHSRYWTKLFVAIIFLSILAFMGLTVIYCVVILPDILGTEMYWGYIMLLSSPSFWLMSLVIVVLCLIPDITFPLLLGKINSFFRKLRTQSVIILPRRNRGSLDITINSKV